MEICQYVYKNFFQLFFHNGLHASHILSCAQYLHITESGFYFMEISHEKKNTGLFCQCHLVKGLRDQPFLPENAIQGCSCKLFLRMRRMSCLYGLPTDTAWPKLFEEADVQHRGLFIPVIQL